MTFKQLVLLLNIIILFFLWEFYAQKAELLIMAWCSRKKTYL